MVNFLSSSKHAFYAIVLASSSLLAACGGGGEGTSAAAGADAGTTATAPSTSNGTSSVSSGSLTLSGTPLTTIAAGRSYSFAPSASPSAGVSFSITNKPTWATFSTVTGALTGTPTAANVGTTSGIVITANNASSSVSLTAFDLTVTAQSAGNGAATLSWTPPTQNTDGSSVTNLAGYNIYYGTDADDLTTKIQVTNPGLTAYTVADLGAGTYYFSVSAYTANGVESAPSAVGSKTIS